MSIDRLSAEDQLMLGASAVWPQDIGALALLDGTRLLDASGQFRIEAVQGTVRSRLDLVPRFRQRIEVPGRGRGAPLWTDARGFDIRDHVRALALPEPADEGAMLLAAERLRRRRLDPSRPPWEMWFITGLPDRRVALYVKVHHAMADGMAALSMLGAFLDAGPDTPAVAPRPWLPDPRPSARDLMADALWRRIRALESALSVVARPRAFAQGILAAWPATREVLADDPSPHTSLDRMAGPGRHLAMVRGRTDLVRDIARANDATANDVLLALIAGGLRALLTSRGESVEGVALKVYVPVSLRRRLRGDIHGNRLSQMVVPLPLSGTDPGDRLRRIATETATRKSRHRPSLGTLFRGRVARRLLLKVVVRQRVNVTTASIPGPRRPRYLTGARMLEVFPVLPLIGNVALGVGAVSYAGAFCIGVAADQEAYPDLEVFTAAVRDDLRALVRASRPTAAEPALAVPGERSMPTPVEARFVP